MQKKIHLGMAMAAFFSVFMLVFSGSCFAQGQGQGQGRGQGPAWMSAGDDMPGAFIKAEDKDGDGKVAKDEFRGPETMFESLDQNKDGYIELSEAPTPETMKGMMGGHGGGPGGPPPQGAAPGGDTGNAPEGN